MNSPEISEISLKSLSVGIPTISPGVAVSFAEAGAVCFDDQGHTIGTLMKVDGSYKHIFSVDWPEVTNQMKNFWHDEEVTTEHGAYGVAFLLIRNLTEFTVVQRSRKGTGFDYWLGSSEDSLFQNMARLEVSGIRHGDTKDIACRKSVKIKQIDKSNKHLPGFVVVVEFGSPVSHVVKKDGC